MTFIIARGSTGGSGPKLATSVFDQSVAALGGVLFAAMKADRRIGIAPYDRKTGETWISRPVGTPVAVVENDPAFGHDVMKYTDSASSANFAPKGAGAFPASMTLGLVWAPDVDPATNGLGAFSVLNISGGGSYGLHLFSPAANRLDLSPRFGSSALVLTTGLMRNGVNVTLASIDAVGRSVGLFQNSIAPITASGGPNPYTTPIASQQLSIGGQGIALSDQAKIRIGAAFVVSEALHASDTGLSKARDVIEAAARTYGIPLT